MSDIPYSEMIINHIYRVGQTGRPPHFFKNSKNSVKFESKKYLAIGLRILIDKISNEVIK